MRPEPEIHSVQKQPSVIIFGHCRRSTVSIFSQEYFSSKRGILSGVILLRSCFHGTNKAGPYFEGWYFKCQTGDGKTIGLIPAFHIDSANRRSASLQVIADSGSWWLEYPDTAFSGSRSQLQIQVGPNTFSETGIGLEIAQKGLCAHGKLDFGPFLPLRSDIMGPFRFLSNMECSHGVISMTHAVQGTLTLNGAVYDFTGGTGYIETDRGRAFPHTYLWAQCSFPCGNLMLSVADIPLGRICFTGCICALLHNGKEYRLATYRGVRVERWSDQGALIRQGKYRLEVDVLDKKPLPLRAPVSGTMTRTIHESLCSQLRCRFWIGDTLVFDQTDHGGSFEYANLSADEYF